MFATTLRVTGAITNGFGQPLYGNVAFSGGVVGDAYAYAYAQGTYDFYAVFPESTTAVAFTAEASSSSGDLMDPVPLSATLLPRGLIGIWSKR